MKEQLDLSRNVLDIIKFKKKRTSHSGPKTPKPENLNCSKEKNQERSNVKQFFFFFKTNKKKLLKIRK